MTNNNVLIHCCPEWRRVFLRTPEELMSTRQVVGKRRKTSTMQARGVARREQLLEAAEQLLNERPVEGISFKEIAEYANVPEGSAYHFYANKYDLFTAVAKELSNKFVTAQEQPVDSAKIRKWQDLAELFVERGAGVYATNPAAQQLMLGGRTPPEIKLEDRINDRTVGKVMQNKFSEVFVFSQDNLPTDVFFYFIEITDLMFSLSVVESGTITPRMLEEAKRAGIGYLGMYLPPLLEKRS